jgi:ferredoxin-nitrite reductase
LYWIGVVLPVGKLTAEQMRGLAAIAQDLGDGDIRLTVWQNLLISGVPAERTAAVEAAVRQLGLRTDAASIRAGLVACTGNTGCRFSASDTKRHAEEIARWCEERVELDGPVNIHLTGCHHSCAQHYIGDIGLLACKVSTSEDGDAVEGYHILVGGAFGPDAVLAREIYRDVKAEDAPRTVERMLRGYLAGRASPGETFQKFSRRHDIDALRTLFEEGAS